MRYAFALFCVLPGLALADSFSPSSSVTDVTIFPDSASITRQAPFSVPAGRHELILRDLPMLNEEIWTLRVQVDGARKGAVVYRDSHVPPRGTPKSPEILAAKAQVDAINRRIEAVQDNAKRARLAAGAAETQLGFLDRLGTGGDLADIELDHLGKLSQMVADQALTARQTAQKAEIDAREIERALEQLNEDLDAAEQALDAITLEDDDRIWVSVEVEADQPTDGVVVLSYLQEYSTRWIPLYDMHLTRGENPSVDILREALVMQETGENWTDVNLTLSTLEPYGQIAPSTLWPRLRRIEDPQPVISMSESMVEPMVEAPVIREERASGFSVNHDGPGVTYTYPRPVSIASGADAMRLALGHLTLSAKVMARAVPAQDDTAYLVADVTNSTKEEILPSEFAALYVDGHFVGTAETDGIAAGASTDLAFGPIDGLRLTKTYLESGEGERGLISRVNQRRSHIRLQIENLTDQPWKVRLLDKVPYSEQDALEINWTADRQPDDINVDDQPGILGWDLSLAPGESQAIETETTMTWPEGKVLH